jgi:hypothetical protein
LVRSARASSQPKLRASMFPMRHRGAGLLRFQSTVSLWRWWFEIDPLAVARPQGSTADRSGLATACGATLTRNRTPPLTGFSLAVTNKQKPPQSGRLSRSDRRKKKSGDAQRCAVLLPAISHEAKTAEAEDHHGPCGGLRNRSRQSEASEAVRFGGSICVFRLVV